MATKTRFLMLLASLPVAAGIFASCGSDDDDDDTTVTPAATATSTTGTGETPETTPTSQNSAIEFTDPTVTASGLRYEDIVVGTGPEPMEGQQLTVHYTLYFTDGTRYQSSLDGDQPFTFVLGAGQVIAGWDEGLANMKAGGKRLMYVPSELAYRSRGQGGIGPDTDLIFEIELLSIR